MEKRIGLKFWGPFIMLLGFMCCHAQQQDELQGFQGFSSPPPVKNEGILKFSPIAIFDGQIAYTGELRVTYEQKIAKRQSITIGASYDFPNFILLALSNAFTTGRGGRGGGHTGGISGFSIEGGRVTLGYRYYPLKKLEGLKGFFVGPYISYDAVNIRQKSASYNYEIVNYANANGITGYQLVTKHHFSFEIFGGLGYKNNFVLHYNQEANNVNQFSLRIKALDHVKLVMQMNFGYAF